MNPTNGVSITWLGHATVLYRSPGGKSVLVDPWVDGNPACPPEAKKLAAVDLMLITHGHSDHFADAVPIAKKFHPEIVCNYEISLFLGTKGVHERVHGINKGGSVTIGGIKVTMVQAIHSSTISDGDRLIPAGEPCGYVIQFENGLVVYHAGDTAFFGDMKWIGELYRPAVAALPIGDLFTMAPREAAVAAKLIGARQILPIHHSTFPALTGTPAALRKELAGQGDIEVLEVKPGETVAAGLVKEGAR
jgi:L-ascorbate metabolism protein UlaG (beta-lactamase superfamily)